MIEVINVWHSVAEKDFIPKINPEATVRAQRTMKVLSKKNIIEHFTNKNY